jgi:hypothetical protein
MISNPRATTTPCGLHVTADVTNATSSAVNYLVFGALPATVVPLHGSRRPRTCTPPIARALESSPRISR